MFFFSIKLIIKKKNCVLVWLDSKLIAMAEAAATTSVILTRGFANYSAESPV